MQLKISELNEEQRQSAIERLSQQPVNVLLAAIEALRLRNNQCPKYDKEDFEKVQLLQDAIIRKAFENILDPDCAEEQEKHRKVVNMKGEPQ